MEASQPGKRAGPLSETNVWLVFIWESQPGKRAECFGSNAHARKERAKIRYFSYISCVEEDGKRILATRPLRGQLLAHLHVF